ncbi:M23 family metallopeptidase [Metasolibacillus sp. FSL H7-0170]|uniref:M23 family metallopeptidase n=1 Tax=Metasolibacillus TaxID=2703677 RepID=UPI00079B6422|nr:M23 family metallopeptidase [Metasolibacillus fluoroglycofenilyticus]KYG90249.1 stage II sporulation protein [[Bacillus] sp. KCTC 13219]
MREEKNLKPSPKNLKQKPWFWPAIYAGIALAVLALMFSYNALVTEKEERLLTETVAREEIPQQQQPIIETNTAQENLKFPFDEALLDQLTVLQDFYDLSADAKTRENALLVFKQTFSTSSGMSLAINSEPFEVLAAMSGVVTKIKMDAFTGNSITIQHANGMETRYSSITDIVVKEGDEVVQGQPLATTMDNDWNPTAGIHLHFEVLEDGEAINPRKLLAF